MVLNGTKLWFAFDVTVGTSCGAYVIPVKAFTAYKRQAAMPFLLSGVAQGGFACSQTQRLVGALWS
jgi:hypothetical protein